MLSWTLVPALQLALALSLGIGLSRWCSDTVAGYVALGAVAALGVAMMAWPWALAYRRKYRSAGLILAVVVFGTFLGWQTQSSLAQLPVHQPDYALIKVTEVSAGNWLKVDGTVVSVRQRDSAWTAAESGVRLMLDSSYAQSGVGPGSLVLAKARLQQPRGPLNPGTFDYAAYLEDRGITLQAFVREGQLRMLSPADPPSPMANLRAWIAQRIDASFPTAREAGVAKALLLGDHSGIDEETRAAYTRTGAVHVLAVSGLHTGIIAGILVWLLGRIPGHHPGVRFVKLGALWLGLFAYVALTGFSPSVQRSAVMFGVLFAGRLLRLDANALNSLGVSALVLLLLSPQLLFSLGFQLSYAAVAGILLFYPTLRSWFAMEHAALNFFGDLVAVGLAATIATAPITTFHFHQFPVYFMLSGVVAVPLVTLALPLALGGLAVDGLATLVGLSASWAYLPAYLAISLCNGSLRVLSELPGSLLTALWPTPYAATCGLTAVLLLGVFARRRQPRLMIASLAVFILGGAVVLSTTFANRAVSDRLRAAPPSTHRCYWRRSLHLFSIQRDFTGGDSRTG